MEVSELVESLDSLWFFSNVVSCNEKVFNKSVLNGCDDSDSVQKLSESEVEKQKQPLLSPIVEKEDLRSPNLGQSRELSEKLQPLRIARSEPIEVQAFPGMKRRKKKKCKTKFKTDLEERGRILTEIDLGTLNGFDDDLVGCNAVSMEASTGPLLVVEQLCEFQRFGNCRQSPFCRENMPPIDDGMAMKEHLKLWAHAVANTVR